MFMADRGPDLKLEQKVLTNRKLINNHFLIVPCYVTFCSSLPSSRTVTMALHGLTVISLLLYSQLTSQ